MPGDDCRRISVVILTRNRQAEALRALACARRAAPDSPLILVDNASTDNTLRLVRQHFPEVRTICAPANLGAAGRNLGVELVETEYVAFCDDDVAWMPRSLQRACTILDEHPDIAILSAAILVGSEARLDPACRQMAHSPLPAQPGVGPELAGFMAGACVMRVSAFRQAGGYWPGLFLGGEESLLALDLIEAGWRILYAPCLVARHWPSVRRDARLRRRLLLRNALLVAWMRLPWQMAVSEISRVLGQLPGWRARLAVLLDAAKHALACDARHRPVGERTRNILSRVQKGRPGN